MKKKELIRQNNIFKLFLLQVITICMNHVSEMLATGGDVKKLSLSDFTGMFNTLSFVEWFRDTYSEEIGKLDEFDAEVGKEFTEKWTEHFHKDLLPVFNKGIKLRADLIDNKDKKDDVKYIS